MKRVGVAILGLGTVGGGAYELLTKRREFLQRTQDVDITVEGVLEPNAERLKALGVPKEQIVENIAEAVCNPDVSAIVECIGGVEEAREYVLDALHAGKTVVTSNKELLAKHWSELERTAKAHNAGLYYGASCAGGVPVVRMLLDSVQANEIERLVGIVNGPSNDILTQMTEKGISYEEALASAGEHFSRDLTADVEGLDAAYKLTVLASLAFHTKVPLAKISREGIANITQEDIAAGKALGYRLKPLAIGRKTESGIEVRVHPAFVREDHPLAGVKGACNAVSVKGDAAGEVLLEGTGSGASSAASAIVSDLVFAATHGDHRYAPFRNTAAPEKDVVFVSDFGSAYCLRLCAGGGALPKVVSVLSKCGIPVERILRRSEGELLIVTEKTHELAIKNAVSKLNATDCAKVGSFLRVVL